MLCKHSNLEPKTTSSGFLKKSNVTGLQGQLDGKATLTQLNNAIAALNDTIAELNITISNKIDEAPQDDNSYVRRNGEWIIL